MTQADHLSAAPSETRLPRPAFDPGLVVVLLIGLLAAWPFLTRPGLPTLTDAQHHVYRTFEVMAGWRAGEPYLRWAPDFFYGFGYPVFNYYAPLTYYLGAAYGLVAGAVAGLKFVFVLSALLGPLGLYFFVRDRFSPAAGVAAAAAFALAPYIVYMDPQARGAAPEALALALAPWVLWLFTRLQNSSQPRDLALASLALAGLLLAHNLLSLVVIGFLCAWLVWEAAWAPDARPERLRRLAWAAAAIGLGVGLAAFFWLPAYLERGQVQFQNAFRAAFGFRFVGLGELLAPAGLADLASPDLHTFQFRLGLPQWILGAGGLLVALALPARREQRSAALFFAGVAVVSIGLMLPAAAPLWSGLPGLAYLQFPWRMLGPAALALAVLAGAGVYGLSQRAAAGHWRVAEPAIAALALGLFIIAAVPLLDPLPWPASPPVTARQMFTLELSGAWGVGTTHDNEFLPVTVVSVPSANDALLTSYDAGLPDKVDRTSLVPGTAITVTSHSPLRDVFQVTGHQTFALRLLTFNFPGWSAWVDGKPVLVTSVPPNGFMAFRVPAGAHTVAVQFEDTPARLLGWAVSMLAALLWLGVWAIAFRRETLQQQTGALDRRPAIVLATLVVVAFGARLILDQASPWRAWNVPVGSTAPVGRLEDNVALVSVALSKNSASPGEKVPLTLNWQATGPVPTDLSSFVHLVGPGGALWGQSDNYSPMPFFPTGRWPAGRVMSDNHMLMIQPYAGAGRYKLVAGLWDRSTGRVSRVLDASGAVTAADGIVISPAFELRP